MVKTDNPRKLTLKEKIANRAYKRQHRVFEYNHSTGTVLDRRKTAFFIVAMLFIPVINWLVFWLYINIQSIVTQIINEWFDGSRYLKLKAYFI